MHNIIKKLPIFFVILKNSKFRFMLEFTLVFFYYFSYFLQQYDTTDIYRIVRRKSNIAGNFLFK